MLKILFTIYVSASCLYWLWQAVAAWKIVTRIPILKGFNIPNPQSWPKLSVIIPACDEAETLPAAIQTILSQDYPNLQIVLVDDRSTDETGEIIDRIAAADDRVRPLHITELPDGWLGKVHALQSGLEQSDGELILFTDADVHLSADALRRTVAYCEIRRLDHLVLSPDIWPARFLADTAISAFLRSFMSGIRPWAVEDPNSKAFVGVGAFNMVRRRAFDATEGFRWLRLEVADDVGLGLMMKRSGARCAFAGGQGLVGLHWYHSLAEMARGAEKGYASVGRCNPIRMVLPVMLFAALELSPLVALLMFTMPWLQAAGAAMTLSAATTVIAVHRWARRPILSGLCFPTAAAVNLLLSIRSAYLGLRRGGITWRGTLYPSRTLREGSRVKII